MFNNHLQNRVSKTIVFLSIFLILFSSTAVAQPLSQVSDPPEGIPNPKDGAWIGNEARFRDVAATTLPEPDASAQYFVDNNYGVLYQAAPYGNTFDIYYTNPIGGNTILLGRTDWDEIRPDLNSTQDRVAYAGNHTGNFEIYTVNTDGSNVTQLTYQAGVDTNPVWSPDGKKIAFVSDRNGNPEIYVMDADGKNQTRLTNNDASDLYPTWSPDGRTIAWVRRANGGGGYIYTMNSDGSAQKVKSIWYYYLENLHWSPDGKQFLFDADVDGNEWNELIIANVSDMTSVIARKGEGTRDVVADGWGSVPGSYSYSEYFYFLYWGYYYLEGTFSAYSESSELDDHHFAVVSYSMNMQVFKHDSTPPSISYEPAQSLSPCFHPVLFNWSASDEPGGSGLNYASLHFSTESGPEYFTLIKKSPVRLDGLAPCGSTVSYWLEAIDNAFNKNPLYPEDAQKYAITYYRYAFEGQVTDNRGYPIPGLTIQSDPQGIEDVITDEAGHYFMPYNNPVDYHLSIPAARVPWRAAELKGNTSTIHDFYLAPVDNLIQNPDFEEGGNGLAGWTPGENSGTRIVKGYTGSNALAAGSACAPNCLTRDENYSPMTAAAYQYFGLDGTFYLLSRTTNATELILNIRSASGVWQPSETITLPYAIQSIMAFATDENGTQYLVWNTAPSNMYLMIRAQGGSWSEGELINSGLYNQAAFLVAPSGNQYLLLGMNSNTLLRHRVSGGTWSSAETLAPYMTLYLPFIFGNPETLYLTYDNQLIKHSMDGQVSTELIHGDIDAILWQKPYYQKLIPGFMGSDGVYYLYQMVGSTNPQSIINRRTPDGSWLPPVIMPNYSAYGTLISASASSRGDLVHVFKSSDENSWLIRRSASGEWFAPQRLPDGVNSVWMNSMGWIEISTKTAAGNSFYTSQLAIANQDSTISQSVELTNDLHQPTLAFTYRLEGQENGAASSFNVDLTPSSGETITIWSANELTDWQHAWVDLSPWLGQTVNLTFRTHQAAGEALISTELDDVSVGSWNTPLVESVSPDQHNVWDHTPTTLTIKGSNFIAMPTVKLGEIDLQDVVWVDENTLQVPLPDNFPEGLWDLTVTNPGGDQGTLWQAFRENYLHTFIPLIVR